MADLIPAFRGAVQAHHCDQMGHVNVQFYARMSAEGLGHVAAAAGFGPARQRAEGLGLRAARERVAYRRELRLGAAVSIGLGVRGLSDGKVHLVGVLKDDGAGEIAARFETWVEAYETASGAAAPWPADVADRFAALARDWPDHPPPRHPARRLPAAPPAGLLATHQVIANPWDCDLTGRLTRRGTVDCFSSAAGQIMAAVGLDHDRIAKARIGAAAVDYDLIFRHPIQSGEILRVESGVLGVDDRTIAFQHYLTLAGTGRVAATLAMVVVMLDLETRKRLAIPAEIQDKARALAARTAATSRP